jgi:hypothetical protein
LRQGLAKFDLHHSVVNGQKIVRLDAWDPSSSHNDEPLNGYWVPQGGSCLIPRIAGSSQYVFTPDFSGCSILVDQIDANYYRVYHVQGDKRCLEAEYLLPAERAHGLGLAGAMTFDDYAAACEPCRTRCGRIQTRGFAFLKFESGRWWIYVQSQNGVGIRYMNGEYMLMGPQTISGCSRIPVADLTREVPRAFGRHNGVELPWVSRRNLYEQTAAARGTAGYSATAARRAGLFASFPPNEEHWTPGQPLRKRRR